MNCLLAGRLMSDPTKRFFASAFTQTCCNQWYSCMLFIQLVVTRMASAYTMMIANIDEYVIDVIDLDMSLKA
jgi:hypothetical protein